MQAAARRKLAGRPLEAVGNGSRRWMVARLDRLVQVTEPGL